MSLRIAVMAMGSCALCGCMDGPFYALKHLNPIARAEWKKDRAFGPTFDDRMAEMDRLEARLGSLSSEQQQFWAGQLARLIEHDPSPVIRARAVRLIAHMASPATVEALNRASTDEALRVRLAACRAWVDLGGAPAQDMLLSMAVADDDSSVRQAAIRGLAAFDHPEVVRSLGRLLDDPSPAIQHQATETLAVLTQQQFGGDLSQWKEFLAKHYEAVPQPTQEMPAVQTASSRQVD